MFKGTRNLKNCALPKSVPSINNKCRKKTCRSYSLIIQPETDNFNQFIAKALDKRDDEKPQFIHEL